MNNDNLHTEILTATTSINKAAVKGKVHLMLRHYAEITGIRREKKFVYRQTQIDEDGLTRVNCFAAFLFWFISVIRTSPNEARLYLNYQESLFHSLTDQEKQKLGFGAWIERAATLYGEIIASAVAGRLDAVRLAALRLSVHLTEEFA